MARVFISYSDADSRLAAGVREWLNDAGHEVFLDRDAYDGIQAGDDWEQRLHERLRWADAVVSLVSSASVTSAWAVGEVATALSRGSKVIPIQVEEGARHPLLARIDAISMQKSVDVVRRRLLDELRVVDAAGGFGWPDDRSPFPGLRHFDVDQHQVFFGRSREVAQLMALLRSPVERVDAGVLLVVGPSGCGKSSLVRAGLVPAMAADPEWWTMAPMNPGADPVAALTRELTAALRGVGRDVRLSQVRERLDQEGLATVADELLSAAPGQRRTRLLLVIDQFEELLTLSPPAERAHFVQMLSRAPRGRLHVVATLRPEFLDQLLISSEIAGIEVRVYPVRPLPRAALPDVIEGPARVAGLSVDEGLVARLVADAGGGEALPLLAYTLEQLVHGVPRGGRLLMSQYEQLGGVHGALTQQADKALAEAMAGGRSRDQVMRGLLHLVTVDEDGRPIRWRVRRADLPETVLADLQPFVARRLLITDHASDGDVVEVAHEAFLTAWMPLAVLMADNVTALRARRRIEQAAAEWTNQGQPVLRLWERGQLAAALSDTGARFQNKTLTFNRVVLSRCAREFLYASARRDRARRRASTLVLATLLVIAIAIVIVCSAPWHVSMLSISAIHLLIASQVFVIVGSLVAAAKWVLRLSWDSLPSRSRAAQWTVSLSIAATILGLIGQAWIATTQISIVESAILNVGLVVAAGTVSAAVAAAMRGGYFAGSRSRSVERSNIALTREESIESAELELANELAALVSQVRASAKALDR